VHLIGSGGSFNFLKIPRRKVLTPGLGSAAGLRESYEQGYWANWVLCSVFVYSTFILKRRYFPFIFVVWNSGME
jgi:hypothetical protein